MGRSVHAARARVQGGDDMTEKNCVIRIAHGELEVSKLQWEVWGDKRATNADLRDLASLLILAAETLEKDPGATDTRIAG